MEDSEVGQDRAYYQDMASARYVQLVIVIESFAPVSRCASSFCWHRADENVMTGMDMPVKASIKFMKNEAVNAWLDEFLRLGSEETKNWTMELRILADARVIMTADPENIKAILTTQFSDYGKGELNHVSICRI